VLSSPLMRLFLPIILCAVLRAQGDPINVGPGVTAPRLTHKVEPEYSPEANNAGLQGTVLLELVVNEQGLPTEITLLSPMGFGLDERAVAAIEKWRFHPGSKDGKPVKVRAQIEVNFRLSGIRFDSKAEERRTDYNAAIHRLQDVDAKLKARAIETIQKLSKQQFPPAMFSEAKLIEAGLISPADAGRVLELFMKAAAKDYGPAMFELGTRYRDGLNVERNDERGMKLIRDSAQLGSSAAQFYLGGRYETGNGVPRDEERARRYFRLCAASGEVLCQFRLARLLLAMPERREHQYVQAIAWLQLAAAKVPDAMALLTKEKTLLTAEQLTWADRIRPQLTRKQ
jgi:TonB family protein